MLAPLDSATFDGIRVLDLSRLFPGPFCSQLLADLGADVWKVESNQGGDYARWYPPMVDDGNGAWGEFFATVNRGKKSIALDAASDEGRRALRTLVASVDVLIDGFRPGVLDRWGLTRDVLHELQPSLVVCRITGFGQTGPDLRRAGHDLSYVARAGIIGSVVGSGAPFPVQVADLAGGALYAAFGIAAALFRRERTGQGADLDISMLEGAASLMGPAFHGRFSGRGEAGEMLSGRQPSYRVYQDADGAQWAVAGLEPKFWNLMCSACGRPDWIDRGMDPLVVDELTAFVRERTTAECETLFENLDACIERCRMFNETLSDPHLLARDAVDMVRQMIVPPTSLHASRGGDVPGLGEHTSEVLGSLGWTAAEIGALS
jgi:crotonobetainyl-CoA:carnitine CoA-transferase CaiB-like acyl-CoA transferase